MSLGDAESTFNRAPRTVVLVACIWFNSTLSSTRRKRRSNIGLPTRSIFQEKSAAQQIVEMAGAQWVGVQETLGVPLVCFRDPITKTTLGLVEDRLTVFVVIARLEAARRKFGV